jgi:hypothetical protein
MMSIICQTIHVCEVKYIRKFIAVLFQVETKTTKTYKGVHFGNLASKRLDLSKGKQGPGPGEYEPYRDTILKAENLNAQMEEQTRFEARIPRYHEAVQKDITEE